MAKTVLVTGGAGFIGSHLVDEMVMRGEKVVVVDSLEAGKRENVNPEATFHQGDIRDSNLIEGIFKTFRPEVVFHLAAQASVSYSVTYPERDALTNILGTIALLRLCCAHGVERFVFSSTGGALYGEPERLPCDEDHPIHPASPYGASKCSAETYLRCFAAVGGFNYTILRYANVYGPRQDPDGEAGVVAIFGKRMLNGDAVTIFGNGTQERDFVYVSDVVKANLAALKDPGNGIYNIGSGSPISVNRLFTQLAELTRYAGTPTYAPPRKGDVYKIYLDARQANKALGWKAEVDLEHGLKYVVDHLRASMET